MATRNMQTAAASKEVAVDVDTKPKSKKYEDEDLIMCRSITVGGLNVKGNRSGYIYQFADYGDELEIEYRDLNYMVRTKERNTFIPRFIIEDDDFVSQYKELQKLYDSLYTTQDFKEILRLSPGQMASAIDSMSQGAKDALKNLAASMIEDGSLDSIQRIKTLDEIFGTQLIFALTKD